MLYMFFTGYIKFISESTIKFFINSFNLLFALTHHASIMFFVLYFLLELTSFVHRTSIVAS